MDPLSLYIHIPFCQHRCGYCDFNTYAGIQDLIPPYVDALVKEILFFSEHSDQKVLVHSVFFGGGTPSLLSVSQIELILNTVDQVFEITTDAEISLEANPGTVSLNSLKGYRGSGVNRLSLGVQSSNSEELKILERNHEFSDTVSAVGNARKAGFENISLDLIFGLPHQRLSDWKSNLTDANNLGPDHISLYALTIENGTPLEKKINKGLLSYPDEDLAADMYEWTMDYLGQRGFVHYEISNWAKTNRNGNLLHSKHNFQYWKNKPYAGFGAGAHSFMGGFRYSNILTPIKYIQAIKVGKKLDFPFTPMSVEMQCIGKEIEMGETMMMGLRLLEQGVSRIEFQERFNRELLEVFGIEISELMTQKLLRWKGRNNEKLVLTKRGCLLGNQVFMRFL